MKMKRLVSIITAVIVVTTMFYLIRYQPYFLSSVTRLRSFFLRLFGRIGTE